MSNIENSVGFVSLNSKILPAHEAKIYPGQSAIYYGTGCFETLKAEQAKLFRFEEHIRRLNSGLVYLGVPEHLQPGMNTIREDVVRLLEKNELTHSDARIRIQVSVDEREGYNKAANPGLICFITTKKLAQPAGTSVSLGTVQTRVVPVVCRPPGVKSSNMLHYRNAFREAKKLQADDGLMMNIHNFVAETSVANIFWKRGNIVYTPSEECDILPGITRSVLLNILNDKNGITMHQGTYNLSEIKTADLVWITNSVREIMPVNRLDNHSFSVEDLFLDELKTAFQKEKSEYFSK
ncbi:MAG: aminotransferase class IV [Balneolaceae bacterium]